MRKKIIAGNWKMNKVPADTQKYFNEFNNLVSNSVADIIICVPYIDLQAAIENTKETRINIGAQNMYFENEGAFTGEISATMLQAMNVNHVILGHSERRQYFNETDSDINLKLKTALENNMTAIVCVGETLEQREQGIQNAVITNQVKNVLKDIEKQEVEKIVIAYEPIWAIGTGKTATAIDANNACILIRNVIADMYDIEVSKNIHILYGGSVKPTNANELFNMPDIDGGLVGGCSLEPVDFANIVNYNEK